MNPELQSEHGLPLDLPVGPQWTVTADEVAAVLQQYGLEPVAGTLSIMGGAVNGNARVETNRGAVVIRVHRPWTTADRLESVHDIMRYLRDHGAPLPGMLSALDGKTWTELDGRLVEVLEYVLNEGPVVSWSDAERAFEQLGLLHAQLAAYPSEQLVPPAYAAYMTPTQGLSLMKESEATFQARADIREYVAVTAARELTRGLLEEIALSWPTYEPALVSQIIHGDYGADNVLLRDGKVVAILDFDFMAVRERVFDVAYSLYWTLNRLGDSVQPAEPAPDDLERAARLLRAYNRTARPPLEAAETEALPLEMARVPLYWIAEAEYAPNPTAQTLAYARHLPRSRWLLDHRGAIGT